VAWKLKVCGDATSLSGETIGSAFRANSHRRRIDSLGWGRPPKATWAGGASAAPEAEQDHSTVPRRRGPRLVRINDTPETSSLQLVFWFCLYFLVECPS